MKPKSFIWSCDAKQYVIIIRPFTINLSFLLSPLSKSENFKMFNYLIFIWNFSLANEFFATSIYIYLLLSDFDHLNCDEKQAKIIIVLSAMYKIKYIHKIIKSKSQKCTLDISCYHSIENKEHNRYLIIKSHPVPF